MSKYTKEEQTEIVRWAMKLQAAIETEAGEIRRIESAGFPEQTPTAPMRQETPEVVPEYPQIPKPQYSLITHLKKTKMLWVIIALAGLSLILSIIGAFYDGLMILSTFVFMGAVAVFVLSFIKWRKIYNQIYESIKNDPDNVKARKEAETKAREEYAVRDAEIQQEYESAKQKYETEILPAYKYKKGIWETKRNKKLAILKADFKENQEALAILYAETGIISKNNRELAKLVWLYEDMSSSEHDLERATDLLNANQQLLATMNINDSVRSLNEDVRTGFVAVYDAVEAGNAKQDEILETLRKTRRDMNIGNIGAALQRRKTNQKLDGIAKTIDSRI